MRSRLALLLVIAAAVSLPPIAAQARHCESQIYLFTGHKRPSDPATGADNIQTVTSSAACNVDNSDDQNLDVIYPGTNYWRVRWIVNFKPTRGSVAFDGKTVALQFARGSLLDVQPGQAWFDSQWFEVDPTRTVSGGVAVATVCFGDPPDEECDTRAYRTLG